MTEQCISSKIPCLEKTHSEISEVQLSQAIIELECKLEIPGRAELCDLDEMNRDIAQVFCLAARLYLCGLRPGRDRRNDAVTEIVTQISKSSTNMNPPSHLTGRLSGPT